LLFRLWRLVTMSKSTIVTFMTSIMTSIMFVMMFLMNGDSHWNVFFLDDWVRIWDRYWDLYFHWNCLGHFVVNGIWFRDFDFDVHGVWYWLFHGIGPIDMFNHGIWSVNVFNNNFLHWIGDMDDFFNRYVHNFFYWVRDMLNHRYVLYYRNLVVEHLMLEVVGCGVGVAVISMSIAWIFSCSSSGHYCQK